jgi:hypothetical protein
MGKHSLSEPDLRPFWQTVRELFSIAFGQRGLRNRETMRRRVAFAEQLGLQDVTVRAFLNGSQRTLGENARRLLCEEVPELSRLYTHCRLAAVGCREPQDDLGDSGPSVESSDIQLTLQFEGFDQSVETLVLRLPPGRAGLLSLTVKAAKLSKMI